MMKRAFEFLYYCLYRVFALVKRVGEKDENLASSFYAILLSTNTIVLFFPLKFIIPKGALTPFPYNVLTKVIFIAIFFVWYFICKYYFLKKENYLRIISFYENEYEGRNTQMAIIGTLYSLFTFSSFIGLAMWLSRM
jgi:hypothetical protein